ncbi:MAG: class F sortase [Chloroflexi bacterium]|nr:class F sortase [Chloroflexota bacterium]
MRDTTLLDLPYFIYLFLAKVLNNVELTNYSGSEGGPNYLPEPEEDSANSVIGSPSMTKELDSTELVDATNGNTEVVIGELVTYRMTLRVPEGRMDNVLIVDTMDAGLAFYEMVSITSSAAIAIEQAIGAGQNPANVTIGGAGGGTGNRITFNLGDVTNSNNDDSQQETIILTYRAVTLNVSGNQGETPTRLDNSVRTSWDSLDETGATVRRETGPVAAPRVTVIEPLLETLKSVYNVTKSVDGDYDAGDTVRYTITLRHAAGSGANAYEVTFTDPFPSSGGASLIVDPLLTGVSGNGLGLGDFEIICDDEPACAAPNAWTLQTTANFDFPHGAGDITLTVEGTVALSAAPLQAITNTGTVRWTSMDGAVSDRTVHNTASDERTGANGVGGGLNNYAAEGGVPFQVNNVAPGKTIASTSAAHTTGDHLVIGERVRYHLAIGLPEGSSAAFQMRDLLPGGLLFLDDNSARVALVCNNGAACISSSTLSGAGLIMSGNTHAVTPTFALPAFAITCAAPPCAFASGVDPYFDLGDLVNSDSDGDEEFVVLEFNALLLNEAGNQNLDQRDNSFEVWVGGSLINASSPLPVYIDEAELDIGKDVSDRYPGIGQVVTFALVVTHLPTSMAAAMDVRLLDLVPELLPLDLASIQVASPGNCAGGVDSSHSTGNSLDIRIGTLPLGCIATVTFDATVGSGVELGDGFINTADMTWTSLAGEDAGERDGSGGVDDYADSASAVLEARKNAVKTLVATNLDNTVTPRVAIGEILSYQVVLTIPPGWTDAVTVTDLLERGLAFVDCISITTDPGVITSVTGGFDEACDATPDPDPDPDSPLVGAEPSGSADPANAGRSVTFDLGDVFGDEVEDRTITILYRAVALDNAENLAGLSLANSVEWAWSTGELPRKTTPAVTIGEPDLWLDKTASVTSAANGTPITFFLTIRHSPDSSADAFDVILLDTLPYELEYVGGSLQYVSGQAPTLLDDSLDPQLRVVWDAFLDDDSETVISFQAVLRNLQPGKSVTNTASVAWSSLPGEVNNPQSDHNPLSTERYYDPLSPVNIYTEASSIQITALALPDTGFAPGRRTAIPEQPQGRQYQDMDDLWLEIPALGVRTKIMGIPAAPDGWDLTWLAGQAGYLEGSAYPTHAGNSAITAHVYLPSGQPGPFVNLHTLRWGDRVVVHMDGGQYTYEVRQVRRALPGDTSVMRAEAYPWLTLITCQDYNEAKDSYTYRVAVRAVLVKVEAEPDPGR